MNSFIPMHSHATNMGTLGSGFLLHTSLHIHMSHVHMALIQHSHISPHTEGVPITAYVPVLAFFLYFLALHVQLV